MSLTLGCKSCDNAHREWKGAEVHADTYGNQLVVTCRGCDTMIYACELPKNLHGKTCVGCGHPDHGTPEAS